MRRFLLALAASAALLAPTIAAGTAAAAPGKSIVQIAAADKQFSTLVSLVKQAGLVKALSGPTKLTLFAPTNAAFAKVPKATLNKLAHHRALLVKVLEYHVLSGAVPASKVLKLRSAKTLEGGRVTFRVKAGKVYVNNARITKTDIRASNGLIHVINRVLIPS
jgi:uncharacterized surface protein with fasciclin (FAS1) repeats